MISCLGGDWFDCTVAVAVAAILEAMTMDTVFRYRVYSFQMDVSVSPYCFCCKLCRQNKIIEGDGDGVKSVHVMGQLIAYHFLDMFRRNPNDWEGFQKICCVRCF